MYCCKHYQEEREKKNYFGTNSKAGLQDNTVHDSTVLVAVTRGIRGFHKFGDVLPKAGRCGMVCVQTGQHILKVFARECPVLILLCELNDAS